MRRVIERGVNCPGEPNLLPLFACRACVFHEDLEHGTVGCGNPVVKIPRSKAKTREYKTKW